MSASATVPNTSTRRSTRRPSFVFILGDDWGWGDLGCFGHSQIKTPCLGRMAAEGTRYTQFYVNAPVCSPSRAAFMTGRFPGSLGVHAIFATPEQNRAHAVPDYLDPAVPTLPRLLQQAGYTTAHFGKWHLGRGEGAPDPGAYGFDVHVSTHSNGPSWVDLPSITERGETAAAFQPRSTETIVDETIAFIEAIRDRPFFVQAWLLDPHAVLNPTDEQMAPYAHLSPRGVRHKGAPTIYYSVIGNADRHIGRLLARLDALGLSENTVVVFTGDNGPEDMLIPNASHSGAVSSGPFRGRKRSLYEGGVRMPLIFRRPGRIPADRVDDETVIGGVDFLPTLCRLAGVPLPDSLDVEGLDGEDLSGRCWDKSLPEASRYCGSGASRLPATSSTGARCSPSAMPAGSCCSTPTAAASSSTTSPTTRWNWITCPSSAPTSSSRSPLAPSPGSAPSLPAPPP